RGAKSRPCQRHPASRANPQRPVPQKIASLPGPRRRRPDVSYRTDTAALGRLMRTQLGKTILFTDNEDWTDEEIVLGYRAQHHIESAFRDMKNPHFLVWSPMFHCTDSKIRVHAFYCVLALTLTSLLQRALHEKGHDLSLRRMMELLGGIQEVL